MGTYRLVAELFNVSIHEINDLWGNLGANYIPSICFKFKQIVFDGDMISEDVPEVLGITKRSKSILGDVAASTATNIIQDEINDN